jgi:hypothetical protein
VALGAFAGCLGFILFLCGHMAGVRLGLRALRPRLSQLALVAALAAVIAALWWLGAGALRPLALAWGVLTLLALYALYMPFYYTVVASLSVQSLVLMARAGGTLAKADLQRRFASRALVAQRMQTMATNGFLVSTAAGYALSAKGLRVAQVFALVKDFWRLGPGG